MRPCVTGRPAERGQGDEVSLVWSAGGGLRIAGRRTAKRFERLRGRNPRKGLEFLHGLDHLEDALPLGKAGGRPARHGRRRPVTVEIVEGVHGFVSPAADGVDATPTPRTTRPATGPSTRPRLILPPLKGEGAGQQLLQHGHVAEAAAPAPGLPGSVRQARSDAPRGQVYFLFFPPPPPGLSVLARARSSRIFLRSFAAAVSFCSSAPTKASSSGQTMSCPRVCPTPMYR